MVGFEIAPYAKSWGGPTGQLLAAPVEQEVLPAQLPANAIGLQLPIPSPGGQQFRPSGAASVPLFVSRSGATQPFFQLKPARDQKQYQCEANENRLQHQCPVSATVINVRLQVLLKLSRIDLNGSVFLNPGPAIRDGGL